MKYILTYGILSIAVKYCHIYSLVTCSTFNMQEILSYLCEPLIIMYVDGLRAFNGSFDKTFQFGFSKILILLWVIDIESPCSIGVVSLITP